MSLNGQKLKWKFYKTPSQKKEQDHYYEAIHLCKEENGKRSVIAVFKTEEEAIHAILRISREKGLVQKEVDLEFTKLASVGDGVMYWLELK